MIDSMTIDDIKDMFSSAVYRRGRGYYREGRVRNLYFDPIKNSWSAEVRGTKTYHVTIEADDVDISTNCNCPANKQYWDPCKHIAAVLLKIQDSIQTKSFRSDIQSLSDQQEKRRKQQEELEKRQKEEMLKRQQEYERQQHERQRAYVKHLTDLFIQEFASLSPTSPDQKSTVEKDSLMVEWIFKIHNSYNTSNPFLTLEIKVGLKRTYVVKKLKDFLTAIEKQKPYEFTKTFTYDPANQEFIAEDQDIISLLQKAVQYEETYQAFHPSYYRTNGLSDERAITIPPFLANELLEKLSNQSIRFENGHEVFNEVKIYHQEMPFSIKLDKGERDDFQLDLTALASIKFLDLYGYILQRNEFYILSPIQQTLIKELKKIADRTNSSKLPIDSDQIEPFLSYVVPKMSAAADVKIAKNVSRKIVQTPLQAQIYVDRIDETLHVSLTFYYGEHKINPFQQVKMEDGSPIIMREAEKERAIIEVLESTSLKFNGKFLFLEGEEEIFSFLYDALPKLEDKAEVFLTNAVKSFMFPAQSAPVTNIDVDSSGNWLEVSFDMEGIEEEEIRNILKFAVEKKKYYRLPNGAFISLESDEFQTIQTMVQELNIETSQLQKASLKLPLYRGIQLEEIIDKEKGKYGKQFRRLVNRLKNPEELDFETPPSLQAELRDYQNYGFQWLKTLKFYRLGGILADDMGLGKTLQSIAFILSEKEIDQNMKPALIVAPASLVYNWKNEFQKFAPSLGAEVAIGSREEREEKLQNDAAPDVWITSYPTLRQDIEYYKQMEFSTLILDEAQAIKNYATKTAKVVREINAETRFALSGTPIENSIDELWSIFQTIMPDFFPNQKVFRQLEPEKIAKMIRPFLLRRVKKDVLKELPDKIETVHYSDLTKEQKEYYIAYLEKIQKETKDSLQGEGFQKSRIKILAGLTRLRQLCCHPSLFLENYKGESGKLQQLMEIVSNAVENGRRLLIFSQFTSMLSIIREYFTQAGFRFYYLDGQTAPKDRVNMVDQFNQGEADIFLISLKAGNTGLNLTGADMVILYDLWWNPAVEEQAAGRAHRIGQKNVVQVIRLITQGTIEEKIYELQQNKKELIETVVQPGDQAIAKITEKEIREILSI